MSEWLKEHAWKSDLFTRADAHQIPPTHSRSTTSRNINTRRGVPVNDGVTPGFRGACDTVLTQTLIAFIEIPTNVYRYAVDGRARRSRRLLTSVPAALEASRALSMRCLLRAIPTDGHA